MNNSVQIKVATPVHFDAIKEIAKATWPSTYGHIISAEQIEYMIGQMYDCNTLQKQYDANTIFLLAEQNGRNVGFASYGYVDTYWEYKLNKLYVLPKMHGRGIGKQLIQHIQQELRSINVSQISLQVNRYNNAVQFYEKLGFIIIDNQDFHFGQNYYMNDFVMRCHF